VAVSWLYAAAVAVVTVVPAGVHRRHGGPWSAVVQAVPFHVPPVSFALNVLMFLPLGLLVPLLWPRAGRVGVIAAVSLAASAAIELTQLALWLTLGNYRTVDVNDLIANTAGGVLGLLVLRLAGGGFLEVPDE
jgi:glycopeptide antibiotics resistance protein